MGWLTAIKTAFVVGREAYRFVRELETQGKARLSPAAAERDRRRLERLALWFHDGEDKGLRRYLGVDDEVDTYIGTALKSHNVDRLLNGSTLEREQARKVILDGADGLTDWDGPAGDRAKA